MGPICGQQDPCWPHGLCNLGLAPIRRGNHTRVGSSNQLQQNSLFMQYNKLSEVVVSSCSLKRFISIVGASWPESHILLFARYTLSSSSVEILSSLCLRLSWFFHVSFSCNIWDCVCSAYLVLDDCENICTSSYHHHLIEILISSRG